MKLVPVDLIIVSIYVDDLRVTSIDEKLMLEFKVEMLKVFEMTDLGLMSFSLGMKVKQDHDGVFICQKKYAKEILKKFCIEDGKSTTPSMNKEEKFSKDDGVDKVHGMHYISPIGCLLYLTTTRPNILFAVSILSWFMHCASEVHLQVAKQVVRYIKSTLDYGVAYSHSHNFKLHGYSDND